MAKQVKNNIPGVYKRGRTWTVHIHWSDHNGNSQQHKRGGFKTASEANKYRTKYLSEIHSGKRLGSSKIKLSDYLTNEWLPQRKPDLKASTYASYVQSVNTHIIPNLGNCKLEELTARKVELVFRSLQKGSDDRPALSAKTVKNIAGVLNRAVRDAVRWGHIAMNPIADVKKPSGKSPEMAAWQTAELAQFIQASSTDRFAALWQLAATTGMRRGELLGLQWSDINLEAKTLNIRRARVRAGNATITDTPKTEAGKRTIHLDDQTINTLKQHKARQAQERLAMGGQWEDTDGHVFTEADGSLPNPNTMTRRFLALCKTAGIRRIRFHDLRHSYVVASRAAGVDIKTISQRIGHADTNVTLSVYAHVFTTDDQAAANDTATFIYAQKKRT